MGGTPVPRAVLSHFLGATLHVYVVRDSFVVKPTDVWVTEDREGSWLTMTTCNPKFSARERLIITAELVEGPNAAYISLLLEGRIKGAS